MVGPQRTAVRAHSAHARSAHDRRTHDRRTQPGRATPGQLLSLVRSGAANTRQELQHITGLSRSTVTHRVERLLEAGLLQEVGPQMPTGRGRPATTLAFADTAGHLLVAQLLGDRAELTAIDLGGRVLGGQTLDLRIADGPEPVLAELGQHLAALPVAAGLDPAAGLAVVVSVPGPVDVAAGRTLQPPLMPGWDDHPVRERLATGLGRPVLVENDANLMALGEQRSHWPQVSSLLLVWVDDGIGAGIVVDGRLYRGVDGGAGDIGHIRLVGHDRVCRCGSVGCLAAVAGGSALVAELAGRGAAVRSVVDVRALVQRGDTDAVAAVRRAGRLTGEVLATVVAVLNPEVLVLGGELAHCDGHLVAGVRQAIDERSLPRATRRLRVLTCRVDAQAAIAGALALALDEIFAPDAVDARLG